MKIRLDRDIRPAVKNEFIGKTELAGGVITGNLKLSGLQKGLKI